jgi:cystathionine beta-lyase/cystathionine gamma-synthase
MGVNSNKNLKAESLAVHAGTKADAVHQGVNTPIHTSTSINYLNGKLSYPRLQNVPNIEAVTEKIAALHKMPKALVYSSGMAAISAALLTALKPGDHFLIQKNIYGGTYKFIHSFLHDFGVRFSWFDADKLDEIPHLIQENTKLIYIETISNPTTRLIDIERVVQIAKTKNLLTFIDNTFASPVVFTPADYGVDVIIESATKYFAGHSDLMAGAIICREDFYTQFYSYTVQLGAVLDALTAYQLERSIKTMWLRVGQQCANALQLAEKLQNDSHFQQVLYPGLPSHPEYHLAKKYFNSAFGGIVSFNLSESIDVDLFQHNLKMIAPAVSLAGVESTINCPVQTSHRDVDENIRLSMGITPNTMRLSVGIENVEDIFDDLIQAAQKAAV